MNLDKNYFLSRLNAGESMDTIGQSIADLMNEAQAEYTATVAKHEVENQKRELATEMATLVQKYGNLVHPGLTDEMDLSEEDITSLIESMDAMFKMMNQVKSLVDSVAETKSNSDDEKISAFLSTLFN